MTWTLTAVRKGIEQRRRTQRVCVLPALALASIKISPLCRNIGEVIALNGIIFLLKGFWSGFSDHRFVGAMIAWLCLAGFDVWYIGKRKRYQN